MNTLTDDLIEQVLRIRDLTEKALKVGDQKDLFTATCEEIGEVARCFNERYDKSKSNPEPLEAEAVDLAICALSLYFSESKNLRKLIECFQRKLNKWEKKLEDGTVTGV